MEVPEGTARGLSDPLQGAMSQLRVPDGLSALCEHQPAALLTEKPRDPNTL